MLKTFVIFLVVAASILETFQIKVKAAEIECEKIDRFIRFKKCCHLHEKTIIRQMNITIAGLEDSRVEAILFSGNENIKFLPVKVYENFPNLEIYLARKAAVAEISASNFKNLVDLKLIDLQRNQIEIVPEDCFQGLTSLYKINLGKKPLLFSCLVIFNIKFNIC